MNYQQHISDAAASIANNGDKWRAIDPERVTRMRLQNRFQSGVDIARYTAGILRADMAAYDKDQDQYTHCLLYTSPSPRDGLLSRMPSSA